MILIGGLIFPDAALSMSGPLTSALAVQSMFKLIVSLAKVDGKFVISENEETLSKIQAGFQKDAEIQYFNLLKNRATELGLSKAGLKRYIQEHFGPIEFSTDNNVPVLYDFRTIGNNHWIPKFSKKNFENAIKCEICGAFEYKKTAKIIIATEDGPAVCNIVVCPHCGTKRLYERPVSKEIAKLYVKDNYFGNKIILGGLQRNPEEDRKIARMRVDEIEKFKPDKGKLLEIGFGGAYVLEEAKKRGWEAKGIEISDFAVDSAREKGLTVCLGEITEQTLPPDEYDAVVAYSVVEHHTSPRQFLQKMYGTLKADGIAVIRVPHVEKKENPTISLLEHYYHFPKKAFAKLLRETGFHIISDDFTGRHVRKEGVTDSLSFIVRKGDIREIKGPKPAQRDQTESTWGQTFIDTALMRAYEAKRLFGEGKIESPDILVGAETSWIPEEQLPYIQELLNKLSRLSKRKGLDNLIIRRRKGKALASVLRKEANERGIPSSNVIILGDHSILDSKSFNSFREGVDPEKWAFFAGVELPENFPENNYIRLLEMLTNALNLWSGKHPPADTPFMRIVQEGKRIYKFIMPEAEPMSYNLLKEIYAGQLKSMKSA
ncbi:MAG: class I SAM-dependent methyltransferase [Candidatus Omnitrophota bacterium]